MDWRHGLFGFRGRANRAKYWLWVALYLAALIVVVVFLIAMHAVDSPTAGIVGEVVQVLFTVLAVLSGLAVMTRRLHDRNKSAWWLLVFVLAPAVLIIVGEGIAAYYYVVSDGSIGDNPAPMVVAALCVLVGLGVGVWTFVEFGCLRGTIGANQYGPDPLEGN